MKSLFFLDIQLVARVTIPFLQVNHVWFPCLQKIQFITKFVYYRSFIENNIHSKLNIHVCIVCIKYVSKAK